MGNLKKSTVKNFFMRFVKNMPKSAQKIEVCTKSIQLSCELSENSKKNYFKNFFMCLVKNMPKSAQKIEVSTNSIQLSCELSENSKKICVKNFFMCLVKNMPKFRNLIEKQICMDTTQIELVRKLRKQALFKKLKVQSLKTPTF